MLYFITHAKLSPQKIKNKKKKELSVTVNDIPYPLKE